MASDADESRTTTFRRLPGPDVAGATLIDGLPGYGMVACIAVREINRQLGLAHYGSVLSPEHLPVVGYEAGRLRDPVRVYAGRSPPVLTLMSDMALPPASLPPVSRALVDALAPAVERAVFLVEIPARSPETVGRVAGLTSSPALADTLTAAGIPLEEAGGLLVGPTGAVASGFFQADVPTVVLLVETATDLYTPDPEAARVLVAEALNPLVEFAIDTGQLEAQADAIRRDMQAVAQQVQQLATAAAGDPSFRWMYY